MERLEITTTRLKPSTLTIEFINSSKARAGWNQTYPNGMLHHNIIYLTHLVPAEEIQRGYWWRSKVPPLPGQDKDDVHTKVKRM